MRERDAEATVRRMLRSHDPDVRRMTRDIVRRRMALQALGEVVRGRIRRGEV